MLINYTETKVAPPPPTVATETEEDLPNVDENTVVTLTDEVRFQMISDQHTVD